MAPSPRTRQAAAPEPGLVSVVIAAWNYARFLPRTLDSALAQAGVPLEVLVVDDGSTDGTGAVLERYAGRVRVLRQANRGLSRARNAGLALARGEFVVFLDADDLLLPGVLASQRACLLREPESALAVCPSLFFEEEDAAGAPVALATRWRLFARDLSVHLWHFNIAPPHAFLVRRAALDGLARGFDARLRACEDYDLWFRLVGGLGHRLCCNPGGLVAYRRHPGSMSRATRRQWLHDALLHLRVFRALRASPRPSLERAAACLAGCLFTAHRLARTAPNVSRSLRRLAGDVGRVLTGAAASPEVLDGTRAYLVGRAALGLALLREDGAPEPGLEARLEALRPPDLPSLRLSATTLARFADGLAATLAVSDAAADAMAPIP